MPTSPESPFFKSISLDDLFGWVEISSRFDGEKFINTRKEYGYKGRLLSTEVTEGVRVVYA